jgi:hypothetical protein
MYRLVDLGAVDAVGGVGFSYAMQVFIERDMMGAEGDVEAGETFGEVCY